MEELAVICPACGEEILLDFAPEIGDLVSCPQCNTSSEVVRKDPVALVAIKDETEDFLNEDSEDPKDIF